jgi:hypothetical protein
MAFQASPPTYRTFDHADSSKVACITVKEHGFSRASAPQPRWPLGPVWCPIPLMIALRRVLPAAAAAICAASALVTHFEEDARQARCAARKAEFQWEERAKDSPTNTVVFDFECDAFGPMPQFSAAGLVTMTVGTPALPLTLIAALSYGAGEGTGTLVTNTVLLLMTGICWYWFGLRLDSLRTRNLRCPPIIAGYMGTLLALSPAFLLLLTLSRLLNRHGSYGGNNIILWWIWVTWAVCGTFLAARRWLHRPKAS